MIVHDPQMHFVCIFSTKTLDEFEWSGDNADYLRYKGKRLTNKEFLEHWGKWIALGSPEEVERWAKGLDPYVEQGLIPCCKYDRTPLEFFDLTECVMCVYCDDREREEVLKILTEMGITLRGTRAWVYDREVIERWSPGGANLEKWLAAHGIEGEEAERIREDARRRFERTWGDEDALARGWDHGIS